MSASAISTRTGRVSLPVGPVEYVESGAPQGPPVVLLHGLLMNAVQWDAVMPHLPDTHRYLRPVFPLGGHRLPMNTDADLTLFGLVAAVADFLDALDLHDVTLVISDWGGPMLLTHLGRDSRVGRLVICPSEAYDNYPPGLPGKMAVVAARLPGGIAMAVRQLRVPWLRRLPLLFGWMARHGVEQSTVEAWTDHALASPQIRRDVLAYCRTAFDDDEMIAATEALARFPRPVLILWNPDDRVMPFDHARRLAATAPDATLTIIDDSYTLIMLDQPAATAAAIAGFLPAPPVG